MESAEIARRFLAYFEQQGHTIVPFGLPGSRRSHGALRHRGHAAVQAVPARPADARRTSGPRTCRSACRTLDIEEVGKTTRHATFFQMLGNWSFGDYFKEGAIKYAWELLTTFEADGGFGLPGEQALGHRPARRRRGVRDLAERDRTAGRADPAPRPGRQLLAHGRARARWPVLGDLLRPRTGVRPRRRTRAADEDRYLEVWNLVFMQDQLEQGPRPRYDFDIEGLLPLKNVDTGMGLERMASILPGRRQPLRDRDHVEDPGPGGRAAPSSPTAATTRVRRGAAGRRGTTCGASATLVEDGVLPGNEGRGHVLRRIVRRSIRQPARAGRAASAAGREAPPSAGRHPGGGEALHARAGPRSRSTPWAATVPRLRTRIPHILNAVVDAEEAAFASTLRTGTAIFDVGGGGDVPAAAHWEGLEGVPAARHLRLPDRPDPGDGGGAGPSGWTRTGSAW